MSYVDSRVYLTWPVTVTPLPDHLRRRFLELESLMRTLIVSARREVVLISPYLGIKAMRDLRPALAVAAGRGVWVRVVVSGDPGDWPRNELALRELTSGLDGSTLRRNLRVLTPASKDVYLVHGKALLVDGHRGYLGSANLSSNGLSGNVEFGVSLTDSQADLLSSLASYMEAEGLLADITERCA